MLLCFLLSLSSTAQSEDWTKKQAARVKIEANRAVRAKDWTRAIELARQLSEASQALYGPESVEYIDASVRLIFCHNKAERLQEIPDRLESTYLLAKEKLGPAHKQTVTSRFLLYKFLVAEKRYEVAIPLVREKLSILKPGRKGAAQERLSLNQLRFLYDLLGMAEEEALALKRLLDLDAGSKRSSSEYYRQLVLDLGNNYCQRQVLTAFSELMKEHSLYYFCDGSSATAIAPID